MEFPKISIITPTLNQSQFIVQTIDSVLSQNYPNLEYFVIDGGSTDATIDILKSYSDRLVWISEKDKGQADAINKGIHMASGEIIAFLNSDDYYFPGVLEKVASIFQSNPTGNWLTGSYRIVNSNNQSIQPFIVEYKNFLRNHSSMRTLRLANYIVQPSTFWRNNVHSEIGFFDDKLRFAFDYDFWLKLQSKFKPICTNEPFTAFRIHTESKGGKEYRNQFDEELRVLRRYTTSKKEYYLHKIHNKIIVLLYRLIK